MKQLSFFTLCIIAFQAEGGQHGKGALDGTRGAEIVAELKNAILKVSDTEGTGKE